MNVEKQRHKLIETIKIQKLTKRLQCKQLQLVEKSIKLNREKGVVKLGKIQIKRCYLFRGPVLERLL